jgi:hypothetical protein
LLYGTPWWVLAQTRQEACDRLETTVMRPSGTRENKQTTNIVVKFILQIGENYFSQLAFLKEIDMGVCAK